MASRYTLGTGLQRRTFPLGRFVVVFIAVSALALAGGWQVLRQTPPADIQNGQPVTKRYPAAAPAY